MNQSSSFSIGALNTGNSQLVVLVPECFAFFLSDSMFCMRSPRCNGFQAGPIRDRDAKAVRPANGLHTEKTRLIGRQFAHVVSHLRITTIARCAQG